MTEFLAAIENSHLSVWMRESPSIWAYPTVLTLHTIGLALLVGANMALDLRILGFASAIPFESLRGLFRTMWIGFWINLASGVLLFVADATGKGSTRLFIGKLALVAVGVVGIPFTRRAVYGSRGAAPAAATVGPLPRAPERATRWAVASIVVWLAAIAAGRLMAYI